MYEAIKKADEFGLNKVFANSRDFIQIIEELSKRKQVLLVSELITQVLNKTGYIKSLELENSTQADNRIENLEEFLTVSIEFEEEFAENSLGEFLESITLSSDIDDLEDETEKVTLMTLHSSKGLEFPAIFLVGMEEGIFPSYRSIGETKKLEEERRLCYVGITRAREYLFLTCSKQRTIFGATSCNKISRFVEEIPEELREGYKEKSEPDDGLQDSNYEWKYGAKQRRGEQGSSAMRGQNSGTAKSGFQFRTAESFLSSLVTSRQEKTGVDLGKYKLGQKVSHKKFGIGIINSIEQEGEDLKVDITFEKAGHKRLMAKFANLEIIE